MPFIKAIQGSQAVDKTLINCGKAKIASTKVVTFHHTVFDAYHAFIGFSLMINGYIAGKVCKNN